MRLLCFVLAAAFCTSAFAAVDCTTFNTKDTCTDSSCEYTETFSCTNKCAGLPEAACGKNENSGLCEPGTQTCTPTATNCAEANGNTKEDCTGKNNACIFTDEVSAKCSVKADATTACSAANGDKTTCDDVGYCTYTKGAFVSCSLKSSMCKTLADCNITYCEKVEDECVPTKNCSGFGKDDCPTSEGCQVTAEKCEIDTATCNPSSPSESCTGPCEFKAGSCASKTTDLCNTYKTEGDCSTNQAECDTNLATGSCAVTDGTCEGECSNAEACESKAKVDSICANPSCGQVPSCGEGCTLSAFACNITLGKECKADAGTSDSCTGSAFCDFKATVNCATASGADGTNGVILAFSGLIALFVMLF